MVYQGSKEIVEKGNTDWVTVGFYLLFVLLGWLNIYAASFDLEHATSLFDLSGRQEALVWIGTSTTGLFPTEIEWASMKPIQLLFTWLESLCCF